MGMNVKIILAITCFAVIGIYGCRNQKNTFPQKTSRGPCVKITVDCPNASCSEVEMNLAVGLEKELMAISGSKTVMTSCQMGLCEAKVYLKPMVNIEASLDSIANKMLELRSSLLADAGEVDVSVIQEQTLIITVDVYGNMPIIDLANAAEKLRTQILVDLPDSVKAEITGQKEMHIQLDPLRMQRYKIPSEIILKTIRLSQDALTPDIVLAMWSGTPLLLRDVAAFSEEFSGPIIRTDGKKCVEIKLYALSDEKLIEVAEQVGKSIYKHMASLPENVQCKVYNATGLSGKEPVRLSLTLDLNQFFSTDNEKQEIKKNLARLVHELEKQETIDSIRSIISEHDTMIELTFKPNMKFQQAIKLIRDENIKVEVPFSVGMFGPDAGTLTMRQIPIYIEHCPPSLLAMIDIFGSGDIDALKKTASQVSKRLHEANGIGSIKMNGLLGLTKEDFCPTLNRPVLKRLDISPQEVLNECKLCTEEGEVLKVNSGSSIVRVFYKVGNIEDYQNITFITKSGYQVPLYLLVDVNAFSEIQEISRINGIRAGSMNIFSDGTRDAAELIEQIQNVIDDENNKAHGEIEIKLFVN